MKIPLFLILIVLFLNKPLFSQLFTEQTDVQITGINEGDIDWGDYNADGLLDFMMTGRSGSYMFYSGIFKNLGNNAFEEIADAIPSVYRSSLEWGDYDNNNFVDIVIQGHDYTEIVIQSDTSEIYKNNTDGTFTRQSQIGLKQKLQGEISWGDFNNDGYLDILQTGTSEMPCNSIIYQNDHNGNFENLMNSIPLPGLNSSSLAWGDYNNDGFLDFIISGYSYLDEKFHTHLYTNDGNDTFSEIIDNNIIGCHGNIDIWDYNNDGFLDIVMCGGSNESGFWYNLIKIYKNINGEYFEENTYNNLINIDEGYVIWGDYNNDGFADIFLTGYDSNSSTKITKIYKNNGDETFTEQVGIGLIPVFYSSLTLGDYDNDYDLDILLAGVYASPSLTTKLYKNNIETPNIKPNVITNLQTEISGNSVIFSWDEATDNNQPSAGLSYNLYIYEEGSDTYLCSPQAFPQSHELNGKRMISRRGQIQGIRENGRVRYILKDIFEECKKYYWSVQAIDASFAGGEFAIEQLLIFDNQAPIPNIENLQTIYSECELNSLPDNFASDNCTGEISGINNAIFPITNSTTIIWTYADEAGNISTQNHEIIITDDISAPIPIIQNLPTIYSECELNSLPVNFATDNCSGEISGINNATFPITNSTTVVWTYTDDAGNISTQNQEIIIENLPPVVITNDKTIFLDINNYAAISNEDINNGSYDDCGIESLFLDIYEFTDKNIGENIVNLSAVDNIGNISTKNAIVTVVPYEINLFIPNFFTPNSDGINDTWEIEGIEEFPDTEIIIYDRLGKLITKYKGTEKGWDGTYNNKPLPSDSYWYVINLNSHNKTFTGYVTVKR